MLTAIFLLVPVLMFGASPLFAQDVFEPLIGITLRGVTEEVVEQGEPMRVDVQLRLDDNASDKATMVLAPASGTWADGVSVELVDGQGNPTGIAAQSFAAPDKALAILNKDLVAGGLWRFKSGATASLAPGAYAIRARLSISKAAPGSNGWTGEVSSKDIPLEIAVPSDTPERFAQSALATAQEALLDGRLQDAAAGLDALLARQPDNVEAWTLRAAVAERAGNILAALQCVNEGQTRYAALGLEEPDLELHAMTRRLMTALEEAKEPKEVSAPLDDWSWPPKVLLSGQNPVPPPPPPPENGDSTATSPAAVPVTQEPGLASAAAAIQPEKGSTSPTAATASSLAPGQTSANAEPVKESVSSPTVPAAAAPVAEVTVVPAAEAVESDFLTDPRGQWAASAKASSEYGKDRYNAAQAIGAPNVASYSDNPNAWCPTNVNKLEWLDLTFAQPVTASELRVRQSYTPGTFSKVEAFAADGRSQILWEGTDPNTYVKGKISWFVLRFPPPEFPVQRVKLTLNIGRVPGWKQIDAVQLVGEAD